MGGEFPGHPGRSGRSPNGQRAVSVRPITGSQTCPRAPRPSAWPASRGGAPKIELDDTQLKGELGLDHYEGRSWLGGYHHTALVTATHGVLTLERQHPKSPTAGLTLPQAVLLLQPTFTCWTGRCQTCQQPIDLDQLPLHPARQHE